jgi:hypothetical protein
MRMSVSQLRRLLASTLVCAGVWLIARWMATQLALTTGLGGIAAFAAAGVALYPLAQRNKAVPPWMHWARGGFVLVVLWLFTMFAR